MNEATRDAARGLQAPLQYLKGVGPQRAKLLSRLGLETIEDALFFVPRRHEDRSRLIPFSQLTEGKAQTCSGTVVGISPPPPGRPRMPLAVTLRDSTGYLTAVWFNQPYRKDEFKRGQTLILHGRVARFRDGPLQMQHPEAEPVEEGEDETIHTGRLVPIYRLTEGLPQRWLRSLLWRVVEEYAGKVPESLPEALRRRRHLAALPEAVRAIHFPQTEEELAAARRRLVFDDFLLLQLGLAIRRQREGRERGLAMAPPGELGERLRLALPFRLTAAQERVWEEIRRDLAAPYPMNRLLQGDVGSGKTVVAVLAILTAVEAGYQAAVMAPTEILAEQHLWTLRQWLPPLGVPVELLTAAIKGRERQALLDGAASGELSCLVGTHALIQEGVEFRRLGLAVVDEQHRFGVVQRATLRRKGENPHVLVMTATPIPRTLALTLYGDLDVSVIDEMPPGRQPIVTVARSLGKRVQIYAFLHQQIKEGRQVYIVCPLVEESEATDLKAATEMAERLQREVFSDLKVGLLHGRMSLAEKEVVMGAFKDGQIHILVSTTVIEVGIDVPNVSVMLVEHAERFGLSQLHQLRGRVGRGPWKSYCLLLESGMLSAEARRRIEAMTETQDGFRIAEVDLELRGPGDFFGTRQSGLPEFRVADLLRDGRVLEEARQEAFALVASDPDLRHPEHRALRGALLARWRGKLDLASVG
ncbi:MAG: ATP-dependent DNA helicase RecG [Candidatus Rokubacteria bacterium]|nr:ATP-dependent DNA helicase RecG [Candidatus Rokubacteria bacterium]